MLIDLKLEEKSLKMPMDTMLMTLKFKQPFVVLISCREEWGLGGPKLEIGFLM